jgi:amino acid transporter
MTDGSAWENKELSRDVGLFGAFATVVAGTLGAGLFVTLGTASKTTGPSVIAMVVVTGIVAMAVAFNYAYISTIFPGAGSAYSFLSRAYENRYAGFVVTWAKWLGYMAAQAALAIGFGSYLAVFLPGVDQALAGFGLLTLLFLINMVGIERYSLSQNIIFSLLVVSILVLVIPGSWNVEPANYTPFLTGGLDGALQSAVPLFYAYIGIAVAGMISAEVKNPDRNLPIALVGGTGFLIFIYVWTAIVIYGVVNDWTVLANSARPLATAGEAFLPFNATAIVAFGGLLATTSSVHAVMAAAIKMPYSWGWDQVFPQWFSEVNERWRTPHWSLLVTYIGAVVLTFWSGGLSQAIGIATFSYLIAYFTVSLTVGYIYLYRPHLHEQSAIDFGGWHLFSVAVAVVGSGALLTVGKAWDGALSIFVPWVVIGTAVFALFWYRGKDSDTTTSQIFDTLPGVATQDYDPDIGMRSDD